MCSELITYTGERSPRRSSPVDLSKRKLLAIFFVLVFPRAVVWSRYGYHVLRETLPHYTSSPRVHRNKRAGAYVGKNDPIAWPPNITFGSKGERIMLPFEGPALMVPPTPDTCSMQRHQSTPKLKLYLRSNRKFIARTMPGRCNGLPTKQHQNKINESGALERKILAWRPVRVLPGAMHCLAAPDLFINRSEDYRPP